MSSRSWQSWFGAVIVSVLLLSCGRGHAPASHAVEGPRTRRTHLAPRSSYVALQPTGVPMEIRALPARRSTPSAESSATLQPSPEATRDPQSWKSMPVVPHIREAARAAYLRGIERGNDPRRFSKVGDCQNIPSYFLAVFDQPSGYSLGAQYENLRGTIEWYGG